MNQVHLEQRGRDEQLEARIASLEMAFRMQGEARRPSTSTAKPEPMRQQYGDGEFANACLLARRLAERGVRVDADLLRQRPAVGRSRRHRQPPQPRPEERPADRRPAAAI